MLASLSPATRSVRYESIFNANALRTLQRPVAENRLSTLTSEGYFTDVGLALTLSYSYSAGLVYCEQSYSTVIQVQYCVKEAHVRARGGPCRSLGTRTG